jgi:hypothetical protein
MHVSRVRAVGERKRAVGVHPVPGLDARVEIMHAALHAVLDEYRAGYVHRKIQEEVALAEHRVQDLADVAALDRVDDEPDAVLLGFLLPPVVRRQDGDAVPGHVDVPENQRQRALPDGAKPDEEEPSLEFRELFLVHFFPGLRIFLKKVFALESSTLSRARRPRRASHARAACGAAFAIRAHVCIPDSLSISLG